MKKKSAADWRDFANDLIKQRAEAETQLRSAQAVRDANRLGKFAGNSNAAKSYDQAEADVRALEHRAGELNSAIAQAQDETHCAGIKAQIAIVETASTDAETLLVEHVKRGETIDRLFAELDEAIKGRADCREKIMRALPHVSGMTLRSDVGRALTEEPHRLAAAVPPAVAAALNMRRPWAAERQEGGFARYAEIMGGRARHAMREAVVRLEAGDSDATPSEFELEDAL